MANLPLTELVVPDSEDVLVIGEEERQDIAALQNRVAAVEEDVAEIPTGTYPDLTAGNIISNDAYTEDTEPYLFKAVGDIYGDRLEEDIVGATVCWNQLVQSGYKSKSHTPSGLTTYDTINSEVHLQSDRVYFVIAEFVFNGSRTDARPYLQIGDGYIKGGSQRFFGGSGAKMTFGGFGKPAANVEFIAGITTAGSAFSSSDTWGYSKLCVFDVTQMLGSVIADYWYSFPVITAQEAYDSMARFKLFAPKDDYEYDTGTLKSVNPTAHKMVGVNAWDEEWEVGYWDVADGTAKNGSNWKRSKNPIHCIPNVAYHYTNGGTGSFGAMLYYDADDNYIGYSSSVVSMNFTTPSNAHYIRFYASRYQTDICINISDLAINGKYFPYEEHTYDLGNVPLYGLFQLENNKLKAYGDVRHAVGGTDRKFTLVDLGTLNYTLQATGRFYATLPVLAKPTGSYNTKANLLCEKYDNITQNQLFDGTKGIATQAIDGDTVYIYDSAYTDAATLKTALSGTYLLYEKATPTTETTDPFTEIQEVSKYGTLEYITTNDVPVGHDTKYYTDLAKKIADLPFDMSMIAPVEDTYTATRNYAVGDYLIVDNTFYKVTSAIANGGTITPNTNVTATTVATELIALR